MERVGECFLSFSFPSSYMYLDNICIIVVSRNKKNERFGQLQENVTFYILANGQPSHKNEILRVMVNVHDTVMHNTLPYK